MKEEPLEPPKIASAAEALGEDAATNHKVREALRRNPAASARVIAEMTGLHPWVTLQSLRRIRPQPPAS